MAQLPKNLTYAEASERLEDIIKQAENGKLEIDELADKLKEAQQLIDYCNKKLYATEKEINKILRDTQADAGVEKE